MEKQLSIPNELEAPYFALAPKNNFILVSKGQENPEVPCYEMTEDMEMIFTFHPANSTKNSNFTYKSSDFVWKYELELKTGQ